jgi:hypothetical protein
MGLQIIDGGIIINALFASVKRQFPCRFRRPKPRGPGSLNVSTSLSEYSQSSDQQVYCSHVDERFLPQSPKNSLDTVYLLPHDGNIYSYYYYYTNNRTVYLVTRSSSCSDCGTTYEHSYSSSYSST